MKLDAERVSLLREIQALRNELAVESHLKGTTTIGTYAIRSDDSCRFLACDFDESSWQQDVLTFQDAAASVGIEVAIERSRRPRLDLF